MRDLRLENVCGGARHIDPIDPIDPFPRMVRVVPSFP